MIDAWRDLVRDLAVAALGGSREVRDRDLLDDLRVAAGVTDVTELGRFGDRLDAASAAIEAYASPGLVLDVLLLRWPGHPGPARSRPTA